MKQNGLAAIEKDGLVWHHVSDLKWWKSDIAKLYMIHSIPQNFLLDPQGRIIATNLRGKHWKKNWKKYCTKFLSPICLFISGMVSALYLQRIIYSVKWMTMGHLVPVSATGFFMKKCKLFYYF